MKEKIQKKLRASLNCVEIKVTDVSHLHQGHSGWREGGETHFNLFLVSDIFNQKSRLERHKFVLNILEEYMKSSIHALSMKLLTPDEFKKISTNSKK